MTRTLLLDPGSGRTAEPQSLTEVTRAGRTVTRQVLLCRAPGGLGARTLGVGYIDHESEVPVGPDMAAGLAAYGIDAAALVLVDARTLRPLS